MIIQFPATVTEIASGKGFADGRPRIKIKVSEASLFFADLVLPCDGQFDLDESLTLTIEKRPPDEQRSISDRGSNSERKTCTDDIIDLTRNAEN